MPNSEKARKFDPPGPFSPADPAYLAGCFLLTFPADDSFLLTRGPATVYQRAASVRIRDALTGLFAKWLSWLSAASGGLFVLFSFLTPPSRAVMCLLPELNLILGALEESSKLCIGTAFGQELEKLEIPSSCLTHDFFSYTQKRVLPVPEDRLCGC